VAWSAHVGGTPHKVAVSAAGCGWLVYCNQAAGGTSQRQQQAVLACWLVLRGCCGGGGSAQVVLGRMEGLVKQGNPAWPGGCRFGGGRCWGQERLQQLYAQLLVMCCAVGAFSDQQQGACCVLGVCLEGGRGC
jgi:hypothetical protein